MFLIAVVVATAITRIGVILLRTSIIVFCSGIEGLLSRRGGVSLNRPLIEVLNNILFTVGNALYHKGGRWHLIVPLLDYIYILFRLRGGRRCQISLLSGLDLEVE